MAFVAIRMLTGDRSKYVGLIFASKLMAYHASILGNIMWRTTSQIQDVRGAGMGVSSGPGGSTKGRPGSSWPRRTHWTAPQVPSRRSRATTPRGSPEP
jgi:hypothetical protein